MTAIIHPSRLSNLGHPSTSANMDTNFYAAERNSHDQQRTHRRPDRPLFQARSNRNSNRGGQGNNRADNRPQQSGNQSRNDSRRKANTSTNDNANMPHGSRSGAGRGRGHHRNTGHRTSTNGRLRGRRNNDNGGDHDSGAEADHSDSDHGGIDPGAHIFALVSANRERCATADAITSGNRNPFVDEQTNVPTGPSANQSQSFGGAHTDNHQQERGQSSQQNGQQHGGQGGRGGRGRDICTHCGKPNHTEDECWRKYPHLHPSNRNPARYPQQSSGFGQPSNGAGLGTSQQVFSFTNATSQNVGNAQADRMEIDGASSWCTYCKKPRHVVEDCRNRMRDERRSNQCHASTHDDHMVGANPLGLTNGDVIGDGFAAQRSDAQTREPAVSSSPAHFTSLEELSKSIDLQSLIANHMAKVDKVEVIVPQSAQFVLPADRPLYDMEGDLIWNGDVVVADGGYQQIVPLPQSSVPGQLMHIPQNVSHIPQFGSHQPISQPITINLINNINTNSHNNTTVNHQGFVTPIRQVEEVDDDAEDDTDSSPVPESQDESDGEADEQELGDQYDEEEADQDTSHAFLHRAKSSESKGKAPMDGGNPESSYYRTQRAKELAGALLPALGVSLPPAELQKSPAELERQAQLKKSARESAQNAIALNSCVPHMTSTPVVATTVQLHSQKQPTPQNRTSTTTTSTPPKRRREDDEPKAELPWLKKPRFSPIEMEVAMHANGGNIFAASAHLEAQDRGVPAPRPLRSLRETTSVLDPLPVVKAPALLPVTPQRKPTPVSARTHSTIPPQPTAFQSSSKSKQPHATLAEVEDIDDVPAPAPLNPQCPSLAKPSTAIYAPGPSPHKRKRSSEDEDEHGQNYPSPPPPRQVSQPQAQQDYFPPSSKRTRVNVPLEELEAASAFPQGLLRKLGDHEPGKASIVKLLYPPGQVRRHISPPPPKSTTRVPRPRASHAHQPPLDRVAVPAPPRPQNPVIIGPTIQPNTVGGNHQPHITVAGDVRQSNALGGFGAVASSVGGVLRGAYRWYTGGA